MIFQFLITSGIVFGVGAQAPTSSCQDLDTKACQLFQTAKPDLCTDPSFSTTTCKRFCGNCPLECFSCSSPVMDPSDCNTTLTCGMNMTCMTKTLTATDGHHEYIMTCEQKAICDGFSLGFGFGKRDLAEVTGIEGGDAAARYQRDVSLSCCDTDFCNQPSLTTTPTPPPTTIQVTSTSTCFKDIVFLVDDSGSVGSTNFRHSVDFVREVVNNLNVGPNQARVAVMEYSYHPQVKWYLSQYTDKASALQQINRLSYQGGTTRTGEALEAARMELLGAGNGERPAAGNVVIVLTDGQSTEKTDTLNQANLLHTVAPDVVSIVMGQSIDKNELNAIATDQNHIFDIRSYSSLPSIVPKLLNLICN